MKKVTNRLGFLFGAAMFLMICAIALIPMKAKAFEANATDYVFGKKVEGYTYSDMDREKVKYYRWTLTNSSIVQIKFTVAHEKVDSLDIINEKDQVVISLKDFKVEYDKKKNNFIYTCAKALPAGLYYQKIAKYGTVSYKYSYYAVNYDAVKISATTITELTNSGHLTMTVKYEPVKRRTGYQIEYSTNSRFKNAVRSNTGATTRSIGKLTKGNIYYVRVRAYYRHETGALLYSKWSPAKKVKIKK